MKQLGRILLERGLLDEEQLTEAMAEQQERGRSLGRILVERGFVSEADLVTALATQIGMEFVDFGDVDVDARAVTMVPDAIARRHVLLPIRFEDGKLVVAMSDPSNVVAMDDVRTVTKMDIKPAIATRDAILEAIAKYSSMADDIEAMTRTTATSMA